MQIKNAFSATILVAAVAFGPSSLEAQVSWTDWTAAGSGTVTGTLSVYSQAIGVTYTGPYSFATLSGTSYPWNFPIYDVGGPGTRPSTSDKIGLDVAGRHTLRFSAPVVDPYLAIMSQGRPALLVSYVFDDPFTVLTSGPTYWGPSVYSQPNPYTLAGYEYSGVIQFSGTFTEISWVSSPNEYWHGITVGAAETVIPEPATVILFATGLLGVGVLARRRRRDAEV